MISVRNPAAFLDEHEFDTHGLHLNTRIYSDPIQERSKASLARLLKATRDLISERGSEEFTVQEIADRASVSIGTVYSRFENKDNLVRATIVSSLEQLGREVAQVVQETLETCETLEAFIPQYIQDYARTLLSNGPLLRVTMDRAVYDPFVSRIGNHRGRESSRAGANAILQFSEQIAGPSHAIKADAAYQVIYATLARQLSLGTTVESTSIFDWEVLEGQLGEMILEYLRSDP